ncbi:MAG: DUF3054 domain-containing protein [Chloroflexaceae bacterium]
MDRTQSHAAPTPVDAGHRRYLVALVIGDIIAFLLFAAIGRRSHGEAAGLAAGLQVIETAAPFLLGWFLTAPFTRAYRQVTGPAMMARRTALAWLIAWPLGLLLRGLYLSRGIPPSFAIVTLLSNGVILCGWRVLFAWLGDRLYKRPTHPL